VAKYAHTYIHWKKHTQEQKNKQKRIAIKKKDKKEERKKKRTKKQKQKGEGGMGKGLRGWRSVGPHTNNARLKRMFLVVNHLQKDKQRKQYHSQCEAR